MQVLQVITPTAFGGIEMVVRQLSVALRRQEAEVIVVALGGRQENAQPYVTTLREHGIAVVELCQSSIREEALALRRLLREHPGASIHSHGYRADLLVAYAKGRSHRWIATVHGFTHLNALLTAYQIADRLALRLADGVIAVSSPLVSDLSKWGVSPQRLRLIRNVPRQTERLDRDAARKELRLDSARPLVGWVGRFSSEKGPDRLPAIGAALGQSAELVLVGDGPERAITLQTLEETAASTSYRWLGRRDDIGALMAAFDILVLPSRTEGMPLTVLEAMAAGIPVVGFDVGDVRAVVNEDTGWLVPPGDMQAFNAALVEAIGNPERREQRGAAGSRLMAEHYDEKCWVEAHLRLYGGAQD